jgi:hypothetical protein
VPSRSGRCWDRTSDLCRVKAARWFAGRFWRMQNTCKSKFSYENTLLQCSGDLLGLLHGCCTLLPPVMTEGRTKLVNDTQLSAHATLGVVDLQLNRCPRSALLHDFCETRDDQVFRLIHKL